MIAKGKQQHSHNPENNNNSENIEKSNEKLDKIDAGLSIIGNELCECFYLT